MAIISEIIRVEPDNTISFGNYLAVDKQKLGDFKLGSDKYKVKTHNELTRCERNDKILIETVPGAAIHNFCQSGERTVFAASGQGNTRFTMGLEPNANYTVHVDGEQVGTSGSGVSGKINFGAELADTKLCSIVIEKTVEVM